MYRRLLIIIPLLLALAACASSDKPEFEMQSQLPVETKYLNADGEVYKVDNNANSSDWANASIAQANSDCWIGISENSKIDFPENADATMVMAIGMIESNRALAKAVIDKDITPCPLAKNTNDVAIAEENGKTVRSQTRWQAAPKISAVIAGAALGINSQNKNAEVAVAGFNALGATAQAGLARAGNNTITNGDNNTSTASSETTTQTASDESSISDSGNFNQADKEDAADDEDEPTEELPDGFEDFTNQEKCGFWGGNYVEIEDRCSNGVGGDIDFDTGELI